MNAYGRTEQCQNAMKFLFHPLMSISLTVGALPELQSRRISHFLNACTLFSSPE